MAAIPWKTTRAWDQAAVVRYHAAAEWWLRAKVEGGLVRDCADTAISLLIDFASAEGLPLAFRKPAFVPALITNETPSVRYPVSGDVFKLIRKERFDRFIRDYWSAQMLATEGLTRPVPAAEAQAGDLCLFDWSDSTHWHTVIVGPRDGEELPLWMVMGNLSGGTPTPLERVDRATQRARVRRYFTHPDLYEGAPRRWDFERFDDPA
jgi:hypothetical protein